MIFNGDIARLREGMIFEIRKSYHYIACSRCNFCPHLPLSPHASNTHRSICINSFPKRTAWFSMQATGAAFRLSKQVSWVSWVHDLAHPETKRQ